MLGPKTEYEPDIISDDKDKKNSFCSKFCLRFHQKDETSSWQPPFWTTFCPFPYFSTYRQTAQQISVILLFLLAWGILYVEIGAPFAISGELLSISCLIIMSYLVGWIWMRLTGLPALIGMLLTGIIFKNANLIKPSSEFMKLNQDLRKIALVIILMRAGLGLNAEVLKKHYVAVLKLGLFPWLVECISIAISTHYLLQLPWIWGILLGSMIASVSPAVVVPCLFRLRELNYGVSKGIPTIVLAAAAIDDSISVAIFAIILNTMFSTGSFTFNIVKGPLSIIVGLLFGTFCGSILSVIPERGDKHAVTLRFLFLLFSGLFSYFMFNFIGWSGAGPLAIVSAGFVAAYFWRQHGWEINNNPVTNIFRILWIFFEPILFALTGAQVTISALDPKVLQMGSLCLFTCLFIRLISTFVISFGCGLNKKEKLFIGFAWTAKATVQAALGPAALDLIKSGQSSGLPLEEEILYADTLLTLSVLSVVICAPLGALLISIAGPRLLSREEEKNTLQNC